MNVGMYYKKMEESLKRTITRIPIVIPSYSRPKASAFDWLKAHKGLEAYVFIRTEQYDQYEYLEAYRNIHLVRIKNVSNIGETRAVMMKWCLNHNIQKAFQLDDDVTGIDYLYAHKNPSGKIAMRQAHLNEGYEIKGVNPIAFRIWEREIALIEKENGIELAFSSLPLRPFSWSIPKAPYSLNSSIPIQCCYINYRLLAENDIKYDSSDEVGWEDLAIAVKARRKGLNIAHIFGVTYSSPPMGHSAGGCNGDEPEKSSWERSKRLSQIFMQNVSDGDPALYIKELPKASIVCVRCHWNKLRIMEE